MKISNETIEILKNFTTINQTFLFRPGNIIRTMHPGKHTFADAKVKEEFPIECAIYEMPKFLSVLSIFDSPTIDFHESYAEISSEKDSRFSVRYFYAAMNIIKEIIPPNKSLKFEKEFETFDITETDMQRITKSASFLQLPHLTFTNSSIEVGNTKSKSSNTLSIKKDNVVDDEYEVTVKNENLKLIGGGYSVTVGSIKGKALVRFAHSTGKVNYWVAAETK